MFLWEIEREMNSDFELFKTNIIDTNVLWFYESILYFNYIKLYSLYYDVSR